MYRDTARSASPLTHTAFVRRLISSISSYHECPRPLHYQKPPADIVYRDIIQHCGDARRFRTDLYRHHLESSIALTYNGTRDWVGAWHDKVD